MKAQKAIEKRRNNIVIIKFLCITFFVSFHPNANCGNMPEKNATLVVKLHKCHIFEKAPSSISDVTKETLHEEELASRAQGNKKFRLKKLNVDGFDAELYFDVKDMQNLKLGEVINLIDKLQANDKRIEASFRFEE